MVVIRTGEVLFGGMDFISVTMYACLSMGWNVMLYTNRLSLGNTYV